MHWGIQKFFKAVSILKDITRSRNFTEVLLVFLKSNIYLSALNNSPESSSPDLLIVKYLPPINLLIGCSTPMFTKRISVETLTPPKSTTVYARWLFCSWTLFRVIIELSNGDLLNYLLHKVTCSLNRFLIGWISFFQVLYRVILTWVLCRMTLTHCIIKFQWTDL